jgi:signal recognition particle GTPase
MIRQAARKTKVKGPDMEDFLENMQQMKKMVRCKTCWVCFPAWRQMKDVQIVDNALKKRRHHPQHDPRGRRNPDILNASRPAHRAAAAPRAGCERPDPPFDWSGR